MNISLSKLCADSFCSLRSFSKQGQTRQTIGLEVNMREEYDSALNFIFYRSRLVMILSVVFHPKVRSRITYKCSIFHRPGF